MARAYPEMQPQDFAQSPGEWQALRGELVALLDQVETQVARQHRQERPDHGLNGIGERLRDLRMQVEDVTPDERHREALRSVKRAVERFNDRDESYGYARPPQENPRDTLASAIQQIRSRQPAPMAPAQAAAPAPTRMLDLPQVTELAQAVGGISHRLERLEGELKTQARSQTGNVKDIAEQVAQLSHVVELLAGAVGETGQVKRLEGQIASLARLVAQGQQVDLTALTQRLDDVAATVGKLADLQVQYAGKVAASERSGKADTGKIETGMRAIEDGVRNIYDRIDAIERQPSTAAIDLEPITRTLVKITEAMENAAPAQGLVEMVDLLNQRISDLENRTPEIRDLKLDVEQLRQAVVGAMEPRFAAIEMQIETLSDRLGERPQTEHSISQLEAQVRQLVNRMDQTGEQLSGLARLYQQPAALPDLDALADIVAARATDVLGRFEAPAAATDYDEIERRLASAMRSHAPAGPSESSATDYEEIERRLTRVMRAAAAEQPPTEDLSVMRSGISEVNERLSRLEETLTRRAEEARRIEAAPLEAFTPPPPEPELRRPEPAIRQPVQRRSDAMPEAPSEERPLTARPFGDPTPASPVKSALEAKNGPRRHPGLLPDAEPVLATPAGAPTLPPRPVSSLEVPAAATPVVVAAAPVETPSEPLPSANTFIQAHRRAARQAGKAAATPRTDLPAATTEPSGSLIGRALARLQGNAPAAAAMAPAAEAPAAAEPARKPRRLAGDKLPRGQATEALDDKAVEMAALAATSEPSVASDPVVPPETEDQDNAPRESFLTRYRRPILLAAVLVAATVLAGNLVVQKLNDGARTPAAATSSAAPVEDAVEDVSALTAPGRAVDMVDEFRTGAIDAATINPAATQPQAFLPAKAASLPPLPVETAVGAAETLVAAAEAPLATPLPLAPTAPLASDMASPVTVEMPPETLGPEALRRAAANGDPRAQFEIAAIYTEGRVVHEDLAQAAIWYERAAAQGFAPAQYRLGNLYENGKGVDKDLLQARLWYQQAAEAGNRMAMHNLAALYASGGLGQQQFDAAAEWFEQAASRGMTDSQFNLGMLYARGLGVKQDMAASYKWFSLAARRGDKDAATARDDVARSLGADDVTRINAEIDAFMPQAIDIPSNYAPLGTWSASFDPGQAITKLEVVKGVQTLLGQLGYDVGTPDGVAGPKTAEAIRQFERAAGMSESGAINPRLLAVLASQPA